MILIKNTQRNIVIDKKKLHTAIQTLLDALNYSDFDIGIWITTNKTIRYYNRTYRRKDKPTDILSFSYHPNLIAGKRIIPKTVEDKNLGDIIISAEYINKAAQQLDISFEQRLKVLLVHGICHLLGYDHELEEDFKIMQIKEQALLKKIL